MKAYLDKARIIQSFARKTKAKRRGRGGEKKAQNRMMKPIFKCPLEKVSA